MKRFWHKITLRYHLEMMDFYRSLCDIGIIRLKKANILIKKHAEKICNLFENEVRSLLRDRKGA